MKFNGDEKLIIQPIFKEIKDNFTYEFWVKPEATHKINKESFKGASGTSGLRYVIGPGHGGQKEYAGIGVSVGTNGVSVFEHSENHLPATLVFKTNITDWTHIAIVYNQKVPSLYINGELKRRGLKSHMRGVFASGYLGGHDYGYFVGEIGEVRIWDHIRTQEQIKNNMYKDLSNEDMFLHWDFNKSKSVKVQDKISVKNNEIKKMLEDTNFHTIPKDNFININETKRIYDTLDKSKELNKDVTILFVGHEAEKTGAPIVLLDIIKWFKQYTSYKIKGILLRGGQIQKEYQKIGEILILQKQYDREMSKKQVAEFIGNERCIIFLNTVVGARFIEFIDSTDYPLIAYIHELEKTLKMFPKETKLLKKYVRAIIADSDAVANNLIDNHGYNKDEIETIYAFIEPQHRLYNEDKCEKARKNLNLPINKTIIYGCGTAYWRKNPKGFIEIAEKVLKQTDKECEFIWIGDGEEKKICERLIAEKHLNEHITFIGNVNNTRDYFATGDIFLLPSIEDPFPLVCLEAAECGLPVICFEEAGGMPYFVENDAGIVIPFNDIDGMASATYKLIEHKDLRVKLGKFGRKKVLKRHTLNKSAKQLKKYIEKFI